MALFGQAPLAVTLNSFTAVCQADTPLVQWETTTEVNNVGFNLWRSASASGPRTLLAFVPSQAPGSAQGYSYSFADVSAPAGSSHWYWLEEVRNGGATMMNGPISITCAPPTAVVLGDFATDSARGQPLPWFVVTIVMLVALIRTWASSY